MPWTTGSVRKKWGAGIRLASGLATAGILALFAPVSPPARGSPHPAVSIRLLDSPPQTAHTNKTRSPESMAAALEHALAQGERNRAEEVLAEMRQRSWVE